MENLVSVIIPTYNSARTLWKCLLSIKWQSYKNIEIIVVDNFSNDDTFKIANELADKVLQKWPERTTQKNFWIENANGKYICFIDSDMELTNHVIESCVKLFESSDSIGWICIPEDSIWDWFFVKIRSFERSFYAETLIESARFFLKNDVKSVGGFEEDLIFFEESLLPQKIEAKLWKSTHYRINNIIMHNEWVISFQKWILKKYYYGKSLWLYNKKVHEVWIVGTRNEQVWLIKRYLLFLSNKHFYKRPILALGVLFLKTLEFGAWWIGFLISNFK